jgi:hypothetical protein
MRGGKREGAGRKKLNHKKITFCLNEETIDTIKQYPYGKTVSEKMTNIIKLLDIYLKYHNN